MCPSSQLIEPCQCGFYGEIDRSNLFCTGRKLNDTEMSRILDIFLSHPNVSALGKLSLGSSRLTQVPKQIPRFPQIDHVDLDFNQIKSIQSGAFNFTKKLVKLTLRGNSMRIIDSNAFQGKWKLISYEFINFEFEFINLSNRKYREWFIHKFKRQ